MLTKLVAEEQKTTKCFFQSVFMFGLCIWFHSLFDAIANQLFIIHIFHLMANGRFHKWSHELLFLYFHLILQFKNGLNFKLKIVWKKIASESLLSFAPQQSWIENISTVVCHREIKYQSKNWKKIELKIISNTIN